MLDTLIAMIVGGSILGLSKLISISFWGFVFFFVAMLMIAIFLYINHKRTVSALLHATPSQRRNKVVVSGVNRDSDEWIAIGIN